MFIYGRKSDQGNIIIRNAIINICLLHMIQMSKIDRKKQ